VKKQESCFFYYYICILKLDHTEEFFCPKLAPVGGNLSFLFRIYFEKFTLFINFEIMERKVHSLVSLQN
jgi:hypothetical protein